MPFARTDLAQLTVDGYTHTQVQAGLVEGMIRINEAVAAANTGTLRTRTNATSGVVQVTAGHGFATSDNLGLIWRDATDGSIKYRTGITVSVSGNDLTISSSDAVPGSSDLPPQGSAIFVSKMKEVSLSGGGPAVVDLLALAFGTASGVDLVLQLRSGPAADEKFNLIVDGAQVNGQGGHTIISTAALVAALFDGLSTDTLFSKIRIYAGKSSVTGAGLATNLIGSIIINQ